MNKKVLVLGDDTRSFLATVRSLGRQGLEVHAAPYSLASPSLKSRYISKTHLLPYYLQDGADWRRAIVELLQRERFSFVIPCDERSLLPLFMHRHELMPLTVLGIPDEAGLEHFFDKHNTRALAASAGVPVARGRLLDDADTADSVLAEVSLPLIIKARKSYAWPELYVRSGTQVVRSRQELQQWLDRHPRRQGMFFEQMYPGFGIGLSVLCDRGAVLQAFEHHRVREIEGNSYYRKSMPADAARLAAVQRMTQGAGFTGIAMFEFKQDERTGAWILLEVNARPWGSMPLPLAAGIDFPYRLYRLMVEGQASPPVPYRAGIYGRNLVADLWQLRTMLALRRGRPAAQAACLLEWVWEFRRLLGGREHHDVLVLDDPRPGTAELKAFASSLVQSVRQKLGRPASLPATLKALLRRPGQPGATPHVLFLCQGNICRSPYAELKLRQLLAAHRLPWQVSSAGLLPRNPRPSPPVAVEAAARHGIDLNAHRSRHACSDLVEAASIIVMFDRINLNSLASRYPALLGKSCFLGELGAHDAPVQEIEDPDGKPLETFEQTYRQIDACLERLVGLVTAQAGAGQRIAEGSAA